MTTPTRRAAPLPHSQPIVTATRRTRDLADVPGYVVSSERTSRRVLGGLDADARDRETCGFAADVVRWVLWTWVEKMRSDHPR
jgi:hypothetical protein